MQSLIRLLYPPQCIICDAGTADDFALCGSCWGQTPFIDGLCCDGCGAPLPGQDAPDEGVFCDDCMEIARPWSKGRAVMVYTDQARRLVLTLKHGDRTDLARAVAPWMVRVAEKIAAPDAVVIPIPLHRFRLLRRRFNQAALLAQKMAQLSDRDCIPDALIRSRRTAPLQGHTRDERFAALDGAIETHPKHRDALRGREVLLIDDVMTSGATFAAATEAIYAAGAKDVRVLALARAVKDA